MESGIVAQCISPGGHSNYVEWTYSCEQMQDLLMNHPTKLLYKYSSDLMPRYNQHCRGHCTQD